MLSDVRLIKPLNVSVSDKYSSNLYRYVKRWQDWGINAYATQEGRITGRPQPFNFDDPKPGYLIIGRKDDDGWMSGSRLSTILTSRKAERFAFPPAHGDNRKSIDVTDWFWSEYVRIGRALWDATGTAYMQGDDDRWEYHGDNVRRCRWSGRWYASHTEVITREPVVRITWTRVRPATAEAA